MDYLTSLLGPFAERFQKPDYQIAMEQENFQREYDKLLHEMSYINDYGLRVEALEKIRALEEAKQTLDVYEDKVRQGRMKTLEVISQKTVSESELYQLMRVSFTSDFHSRLETHLNKHPETLQDIVSKLNLKYQDDFRNIFHLLETYTIVLGYLNNFATGDEDDPNDLEAFKAHRDFGMKEVSTLMSLMLSTRNKTFVTADEKDRINTMWSKLHFPVYNLLTIIHRRVKVSQTVG